MEDRDRSVDWAKPVGIPDEHQKLRKNITQGYLYREMGRYHNKIPREFLWAAEDKLVDKHTYEELKCQLPDSPRSTFLMVFSPDGKKVASTHGNHNVYVTDLTTGKNIQTLSGHPRTPWCIAFHPSSNQILASGCLAGQVRVWDLHGGSEVWTAESQSVIASLAFHPVDRMLVIATYNELHFWDWSQAKPFAKCSTKSEKEKVRYVSFDRMGNKLITGIANPVNAPPQWDRVSVVSTQPTVTSSSTTSTTTPSTTGTSTSSSHGRSVTFCDSYLMNQYSQLVRRYIDLSRSRITRTIDRGTDPMDLVDVQNGGNQNDGSRTGSAASSSQSTPNRPVRYRIMRSTCRSYRPPSSRERFRIHSSLLSGLPSRSSSSSNSLVRTTTTTTTTSQSIILTTLAASSSSSCSITSQLSRLRQCGFSLISRPVCLTISRENSSNVLSLRSSQATTTATHTGAVTNPTYTSYSERSILSTRETNSGETERSRIPLIRPYRIVFDDINHIRASVHTLIRPSSEDNGNRSNAEPRTNVISPLDRRDRLRSHLLDVEEVETDRDVSRSFTYVSPFRRLSSDSESTSTTPTNAQRPSPQHWVSHNSNHLPLHPRPVPRFQVRPPFDLNNSGSARRHRENAEFGNSTNRAASPEPPPSGPTVPQAVSPIQLNAGPIPRLQIRPRYIQDQQSQLQFITEPEAENSGSPSNSHLRRQFVLSRHSNSPFQPRVPRVVENPVPSIIVPTTSSSSGSSRPEIPSCMSSFVASGTSSTTRSTASVSLPVGNVASSTSKATNTATTTIAGDDSFVRGSRELRNRLHFFDHVKLLLRDRIRNSSEHASTDSTVNYSNIADESEGENRSAIDNSLEDTNATNGLGPRGLDPMLSSVSDNTDAANDAQLFPTPGTSTSTGADTETETGTASASASVTNRDSSPEQSVQFMPTPWDSDAETIPYTSSPFASDTEPPSARLSASEDGVMQQDNDENSQDEASPQIDTNSLSEGSVENEATIPEDTNPDDETEESESGSNENSEIPYPSELSVRQKIQILSLHIENMQRLCRARIEIVQLQQIRKMWEDLTAQIRSLHTAVQNNNSSDRPVEENENSNSSRDPVNPMERLAISDNSSVPQTSSPPARRGIFYRHFKELIESMVNALLDDDEDEDEDDDDDDEDDDEDEIVNPGGSGRNKSASSRCRRGGARPQYRNETDEPQPGPSGLSNNTPRNRDYFKIRIYRSLRDLLNRTKKRRESGSGPSSSPTRQSPTRTRVRRQGSHMMETMPPQVSPSEFCSSIESIIQNLQTTANDLERSLRSAEPEQSTSGACHSCGQRKRTESETPRQKRKCSGSGSGSASGPECGGSSSKIMRTNSGGRSVASTSTSSANAPVTTGTSSRELLTRMVERMETMVRFQREAFKRTEELSQSARTARQGDDVPNSSDDSDSDVEVPINRALQMRNLPRNFKVTRKDVEDLNRAVTQLRARRLLDYMIKNLAEFFEDNPETVGHVFDDQIISLYTLLHLSLELTNLLLDRLNTTSLDLERVWDMNILPPGLPRTRNTDLLFSDRSRVIRRLRERNRGLTRSSTHSTFGPSREETRRIFPNPFMRSIARPRLTANQSQNRNLPNNTTNSVFCRYRPSATFFSGYRRSRRPAPRTSTASPSGWSTRDESPSRSTNVPRSRGELTSLIIPGRVRSNNPNPLHQLRAVRFCERRNSLDDESQQRHRFPRSDNNNNNNLNISNNNNDSNTSSNSNSNSSAISSSNSESARSGSTTAVPGNAQASNPLPFSTYLNSREQRPLFWIRYGNSESNSSAGTDTQSRDNNFTVPVVHVNDIPVHDMSALSQPRHRPQSPTPRVPEDLWRWRAWRPRFLHPRYVGPHPFDDQDANDLPESVHYYRIINASAGSNSGLYSVDPVIITEAPMSPHHRIQAWDFSKMKIPDISNREANGVVAECKIHNDASVDVSNDGHLLVTLLPSGRFSVTTMLGVYSLDWSSLGQLLYKTSFEQNAVSVSLSPTNRHLLVGLASRPLVLRDRINMAQIFRLEGARPSPPGGSWQSGRGRLVHMRDLEQTRETNIMSLNCIRWAPGPGQGLVYGTNTGQLKVLR